MGEPVYLFCWCRRTLPLPAVRRKKGPSLLSSARLERIPLHECREEVSFDKYKGQVRCASWLSSVAFPPSLLGPNPLEEHVFPCVNLLPTLPAGAGGGQHCEVTYISYIQHHLACPGVYMRPGSMQHKAQLLWGTMPWVQFGDSPRTGRTNNTLPLRPPPVLQRMTPAERGLPCESRSSPRLCVIYANGWPAAPTLPLYSPQPAAHLVLLFARRASGHCTTSTGTR